MTENKPEEDQAKAGATEVAKMRDDVERLRYRVKILENAVAAAEASSQ